MASSLTSVVVVAQSHEGISELSHVTATLSAYLDCSSTLPLARACAVGSVSLLQRIWEISKTSESAIDSWCRPTNTWCPSRLLWTNQFYYQDQFAKGMIAACKGGYASTVEWLLNHFSACVVPPAAVEAAAQRGHREILRLLLDVHMKHKALTRPGARTQGDKPHQVKFWESNVLLAAAMGGHGDLVIWLYTDVFNGFYMHSNEEAVNELARHGDYDSVRRLVASGWPLPRLDFAAEGGNVVIVQWLLNQHRDTGKQWALRNAARNGHLAVVKLLANDDFVTLDGQAFCGAAENGHLRVVQWLKEQNLGWNTASKAIDLAASNGHLDIVQYLHNECHASCTALTMRNAVSNGHLDIVQWLYGKFKDDLNVDLLAVGTKEQMNTAIMDVAAGHGHLHVLKYLHKIAMSMDAFETRSVNEKTVPICTPAAMQLAAAGGYLNVMQWLHAHYWTKPSVDVMDAAAANGHLHIVKYLHQHNLAPLQ
ncbi:hypothetical protein PHYBOEH_009564 [Phytophthora boehmeriae]|uniref:Ankyrin repeat-containing domain n=1 Tax=Phytophthora boehmeriae TaxID=109152 RepID=A0A8T1VWE0_9STRA|nr:hypothetical protein PHYBOEH_009564 [Phytophthora boehmeriae]